MAQDQYFKPDASMVFLDGSVPQPVVCHGCKWAVPGKCQAWEFFQKVQKDVYLPIGVEFGVTRCSAKESGKLHVIRGVAYGIMRAEGAVAEEVL